MRFLAIAALACSVPAAAIEPCKIEVVEKGTTRPVPLVELTTVHNVRFVSDNAGVIAFDLPELMGHETWFRVSGHGYGVPKDGFGAHGVRLTPKPGATLRVEVNRNIIATRIGRITGAGLFAESQKTGGAADAPPESGVLGCDSVLNAVHRGRLYWFWGDTNLARYWLGIFDSTGATSDPHPLASFEPPLRLKLDYFTNEKGAPRGVAKMPGRGPTWLGGLVSLPDAKGEPRLVAAYSKIDTPLTVWQWGLAVWNEKEQRFDSLRTLWTKGEKEKDDAKAPRMPIGHTTLWTDESGRRWVLFGDPFPRLRCPATFEAWQDPTKWEKVEPQKTVEAADGSGPVTPHTGSIAYHGYRKRWVTVFMQKFGKPSAFGELWYAEADSPMGPWGPAVKVLTHDDYTFYNPRLHADFSPPDAPILFFEGTYTVTFSGNKQPTPRYDYNQMLYRLDLDDPALAPAFSTKAR